MSVHVGLIRGSYPHGHRKQWPELREIPAVRDSHRPDVPASAVSRQPDGTINNLSGPQSRGTVNELTPWKPLIYKGVLLAVLSFFFYSHYSFIFTSALIFFLFIILCNK
jgi:hypothetical protein